MARDFQQAYGLLTGVLRDLQVHYGQISPGRKKTSEAPSSTN
jgi:hypothetical protein